MTFNWFETYIPNPYAAENTFRSMTPEQGRLPSFAEARQLLPQPAWEGHDSAIACYWKVWEIAFRNLRNPTSENGFVSPYIDPAFNGHIFMWDLSFVLLFARYGMRAFHFQRTLDNFYAKQHPDGFICREIRQSDGGDCFKRFDPPATGPNVMPWSEWAYYTNTGDRERLAKVFPALLAFHQWMRHYRTWPDGTYWACGWACGMDNQPRLTVHEDATTPAGDGPVEWWDHDHMAWIDTCLQAVFSARLLASMARELGQEDCAAPLQMEINRLTEVINRTMWDEAAGIYVDRRADGRLSRVKTIGAFWALLAGVAAGERRDRLIAHLRNPRTFARPHPVPTLAADHPDFHPLGQYWRGGVWAPTNYMVLQGLAEHGCHDLAHEIAGKHLEQVVKVFEQTGTVWENYAPEETARGSISAPDFVGWTGLPPTAVLFEHIFGLRPDVPHQRLTWDVRLLEAHGVNQYPFGKNGLLNLHCAGRSAAAEQPVITAQTNLPLALEVRWQGGVEHIDLSPEQD